MSTSLRVLHVAETCKGGVASWLQDVLPGLLENCGPGNVAVLVPASDVAGFNAIKGLRVYSYRRTGRGPASLLRFACAILAARQRFKPNLVHLHSTFAGLIGRPALAPWFLSGKLKIVYTAHGWAFSMDVPNARRKAYAVAERLLRPLTNATTTISADDDAEALRYGLPRKNMFLLRNTCRPLVATPNLKRKQKVPGSTIVFVGRFDRQKGLDILISALRQLTQTPTPTQWRAIIVGEPVHGQPLAIPSELAGKIELPGWMDRPALGKLLESADVVVIPSRWEGFGLVALEAMTCGAAVLASRVGGLSEIVEQGTTGHLVPAGDPAALHHILATTPRATWWKMGEAGLARYQREFQPAAMLTQLLTIYRSL